MGQMEKRDVVTAFLRHENRILLLKRGEQSKNYKGCWSGVAGYVEGEGALAQALQEIAEETGLEDQQVNFVCDGTPIEIPAPELNTCWVVHPFLFDIEDPDLMTLDWKSEELQWVKAEDIHGMATVPSLIKALARCLERERNSVH